MKINVYFKDFKEIILEHLKNAKKSVRLCMSWISDRDIVQELILLMEKIDVKIVLGYSLQYEENKDFIIWGLSNQRKINENNLYLKIYSNFFSGTDRIRMHNKYCIIDEKIVLTGSLNWTQTGLNYNDENLIVINDEQIALQYIQDFDLNCGSRATVIHGENLSRIQDNVNYAEKYIGEDEQVLYDMAYNRKEVDVDNQKKYISYHVYIIKYMTEETRKVLYDAWMKQYEERENDKNKNS